ncbi:MAG TPA: choice-of-anchor D domain-containing protein [Terriglobia bacterium]
MSRTVRLLLRPVAILFLLAGTSFATCTNPISASPSSVNFGTVGLGIGLFGAHGLELINSCNVTITVNSFTFNPPVFGLADGVIPRYINANSNDQWSIAFRPAAAQVYNGTLTINLAGGYPSVVMSLTGTGVANAGVASLSANSVNFGNVPLGSTVTHNMTLTNSGTASFTLTELNTYSPFQVTPLPSAVSIGAGKTYNFTISYTATTLGAVTGAVNLVYNLLTPQSIDLTATGTAPAGVAFTSFPVLPAATQGSSYLATLHATGGTSPYTFHITKGSAIISGLTFTTSTGTFGGSVASTVALGNYTLTIQVDDSSKPQKTSTTTFTLPVGAQTGANCNVIEFDVPDTTTPLTALNDLGTGTYDPFGTSCPEAEGCEGGLYPGGSNTDPSPHASDGVTIGQDIQPRDANGTIDPTNGSIVFMALGVSNTQQPFNDFMNMANGDPDRNPRVAIVNGALGGETAVGLDTSTYLSTVIDYVLPFYGYTPQQVAAVWLDTVNSGDTSGFPNDATTLQQELETGTDGFPGIVETLKTDFPNLALAYLGAVNYTGYAQGVSTVLPEPQSYDASWGDKWAIEDQINGTCCNYNAAKGTVVAPWMGWGDYYWANGLLARQDGTYWSCQDLSFDGTHPVYPSGHLKIGFGLLNFLKTDPTATPWYVAPAK